MRLPTLVVLPLLAAVGLCSPAARGAAEQQLPFGDPSDDSAETLPFRRPTRYESTVLGRRLLALSKTGVLTTVFPADMSYPRTPADVGGTPIGLPEYLADCEEPSGNPTLLALDVSTSTKNAVGANASIALSWWDQYTALTGREPWSQANLPRLSLTGYLEEMTKEDVEAADVVHCFTRAHGDSVWWLPGDRFAAHSGKWVRLVVREAYWIGGFGDRNYIGWFDADEWRSVTREEWEGVKLPGEK